jgi:alkanesulfonate monooxygenase SsuD/methylene tetrahydromethanopterin reductase-like flavin-dependent oxidoreductase (luciferase family)
VLTGGNYILRVGLGYRQPEFDAFGISLTERAPRFTESILVMRRLWTEERVIHTGRFYTVDDAGIGAKPVRPGGPPLYIAGQAEVSVRRAARIGDAWLIVNTSGLGKVMPLMQTYRATLKEYGRTLMEFPITVECYFERSEPDPPSRRILAADVGQATRTRSGPMQVAPSDASRQPRRN